MLGAESFKFAAGTWFFARGLFQAVVTYIRENQNTSPAKKVKGVGLETEYPEKLPSHIDIKKAIPKHCFQPKISTSMYYAVKDLVLIALTFAAIMYLHSIPSNIVWYTSLVVYWALQGTLFTAVFVVGHDCGHDSFSNNDLLNDVVGTIMHGFLMAPYYMWKLTHRTHHKNNCNFDKDEVYYPIRKSDPASRASFLPGFGLGLGWYGYLALGYKPRAVDHFNIFQKTYAKNTIGCMCTLATMLVMGYSLYLFTAAYGFMALFNYYILPDFIFASYCVIITFLHHHEENVPWFSDDNWDFVKGQLSTIDRDYGIVHYLIHSIGTHQMHHMFTKIPHYHLEEATTHFRKAFPELVRVCDEPILPSFLRMFKKYTQQMAIDDECKKHVYK